MEDQRTRNGLLFIIALCLVLIVLRLYSVELVSPANAQVQQVTEARLYACVVGKQCRENESWIPVVTKDGALIIH